MTLETRIKSNCCCWGLLPSLLLLLLLWTGLVLDVGIDLQDKQASHIFPNLSSFIRYLCLADGFDPELTTTCRVAALSAGLVK